MYYVCVMHSLISSLSGDEQLWCKQDGGVCLQCDVVAILHALSRNGTRLRAVVHTRVCGVCRGQHAGMCGSPDQQEHALCHQPLHPQPRHQ